MADPRFFERSGPYTLRELAEIGEASLPDDADGDRLFNDVAALSEATAEQVSFLDNRKYVKALGESAAGAVVLAPDHVEQAPKTASLLISETPYRSFALIGQAFYPLPPVTPGVAANAFVDPSATVDPSSQIDPGAAIMAEAVVERGAAIGPNAVIGPGVTIGAETRIGPNASVEYALVGSRVQIHAGARIGTRGFGVAMDGRGHVELRQTGRVIIGDDVEIGANTTIDRGMGPDTVIGDGCKIDNLVQIGHNARLGRGVVVAGLSGIAGSAVLEDFVVCAAMVGVAGHLTVGRGSQIAATSSVAKSLPPGGVYGGTPAVPMDQLYRRIAALNLLARPRKSGKT